MAKQSSIIHVGPLVAYLTMLTQLKIMIHTPKGRLQKRRKSDHFPSFHNIWQTMKHLLVILSMFQDGCHISLCPLVRVPEIVHLVFNMELLAISSMSEVRSEDLLSDIFDSMLTSFMVVQTSFGRERLKESADKYRTD